MLGPLVGQFGSSRVSADLAGWLGMTFVWHQPSCNRSHEATATEAATRHFQDQALGVSPPTLSKMPKLTQHFLART